MPSNEITIVHIVLYIQKQTNKQTQKITNVKVIMPGPHSNVQGAACAFPFSGKRGYFSGERGFLSGRLSRENPGKGDVYKPISRDMGCFSEASREIKKKRVSFTRIYM